MPTTPGKIRKTGAKLGAHNREVLIGQLGFTEAEVKAAGIELGTAGKPKAAKAKKAGKAAAE